MPSADAALLQARVLLAEDTPSNAMVLERMLLRLGHQVTVVTDGQAAVAALTDGAFDVVLMDVHMPVMDGLEATRQIRRFEREAGRAPLPILALTGSTRDEHRFLCIEAGMDATLTKPISKQALGRAIEAALMGRQVRGEDAMPAASGSAGVRDRGRALAALAGESDILEEVERRVLAEVPVILARLGGAVGARRPDQLEREAHSFKSMLRLVAAEEAAGLAEKLEEMGQLSRLDDAPAALAELQAAAAELIQALRQDLERR